MQSIRGQAVFRRTSYSPVHRRFRSQILTSAVSRPNDAASESRLSASVPGALAAATATFLLSASSASADVGAINPFEGVQANSLYVTGGLVLMCIPGIWSQVKRAPQASKKRKVYEVPGPGVPGALPVDDRARQIFQYFKRYNYEVKDTGEVITFTGLYAASNGQAAAVTFYTFCSMASLALVLSTLYPEPVGNWWYALTLLSPGAWFYYTARGTRTEEVKVKMVTSDDNATTDIIIEGDVEEISRFQKELQLMEKGMEYVKGILGS